MPYDPRMLQMARAGIGMMGPQQGNPFDRNAPQQPRQWWDQPLPAGRMGGAQSPQEQPEDPNAPKKPPQPSLLQMLMLGGQPTYSGTPRPGAANPWGWLGSLGQPPGSGGGYR